MRTSERRWWGSEVVPILDGQLALGTWQQLVLIATISRASGPSSSRSPTEAGFPEGSDLVVGEETGLALHQGAELDRAEADST